MPRLSKIPTQHRQSCRQMCELTQVQTHCCQYIRWPHAGMGQEQRDIPARRARHVKTKDTHSRSNTSTCKPTKHSRYFKKNNKCFKYLFEATGLQTGQSKIN